MDNNQIYHFVKVKTKGDEDSKGTWLLEADSLRVINEHFKKYVGAEIKQGMKEIISRINGKVGHYTNSFASTVDTIMQFGEKPYLVIATELEFEDVNINYSNLKDYVGYNKDGELYHSDVMSFMIKNELFVENELKEYLYPLFEEEKRKIIERELAEYERIKNKYNLN